MSAPPPATPSISPEKPAFMSDPVIGQLGTLSKYALLAMVVTRSPRQPLFDKLPIIGATVQAAAGYILVLGPLIIALAVWWIAFVYRGPGIEIARWTKADLRFAAFVFVFPVLACAFISFQFFLLLAPQGECVHFNRLDYLFDLTLKHFQPEYCMKISDDAANNMPYLIDPVFLQAWLQVGLPLFTAATIRRLWMRWRRATQ